MKIPLTPPPYPGLVLSIPRKRLNVVFENAGQLADSRYLHWDKLRQLDPPADLNHEEWWAALKMGRLQSARDIEQFRSIDGQPFHYCLPDMVLAAVHDIDSRARGNITLSEQVTDAGDRNRYMVSSLIEEAITSSQLEGAATTRKEAVEMLRSGRQPRDHSERMILNNYLAMQHILALDKHRLTPEMVLELHRILARETMNTPDAAGRPQTQEDKRIKVFDPRDNTLLHTPPPAKELPERLELMCRFANGEIGSKGFLHPVIRAIILHFWLAYDHPFEDGNGRTARALFYWAMLREGYWLFEYLSISSLLRKAPSQYARSYLYTETDGNDLTYFIAYQLKVIRRSLDALDAYLARKQREIRDAEAKLREISGLNHRQRALIAHVLRNPTQEYTIESHRRSHNIAYATARNDLLQLAAKNMLAVTRKIGKKAFYRRGPALHAEQEI
ncbi:MAG: Fic family protein [Gammaproteobacteria bacterium]